jgi:uncharacterized membrane protein YeaQ/YmgE (transglycosylase-associated protein family)
MGIFLWVSIGLLIGGVVGTVMPKDASGRSRRARVITSAIIGLFGAVAGGFLGAALLGTDRELTPGTSISALLGAAICLIAWSLLAVGASRRAVPGS